MVSLIRRKSNCTPDLYFEITATFRRRKIITIKKKNNNN